MHKMKILSVTKKKWVLLLLVLPLVFFTFFVVRLWPYTIDDSFIFYHYAQNLGSGKGLVWNAGESIPVEGYTSVLWVWVLSFFSFLKVDLQLISKIIGVILLLLVTGYGSLQVYKNGKILAAIAFPFFILCNPYLVLNVISGMDTALAIFLITLFMVVMYDLIVKPNRYKAIICGILGLLVGLTRPEANLLVLVLFTFPFFLFPWLRIFLLHGFIPYVVIGLIYFVWRTSYFGLLFPLPFYIKQVEFTALAGRGDVLGFIFLISPLILLAIIGVIGKTKILAPFIAGIVIQMIYYLFPRHLMGMHFRYLMPLYPSIVLIGCLGLEKMLKINIRRYAALVIVAVLVFSWFQIDGGRQEIKQAFSYTSNLNRSYVRLGHDLARHGSNYTIALGSVGAVPYYSGWRIIDTFGLTNREVALSSDISQRVSYIWSQQPDVLILLSRDPDQFVEFHDYDRLLYETAEDRGYQYRCYYKFSDVYYLWVYVKVSEEFNNLNCEKN